MIAAAVVHLLRTMTPLLDLRTLRIQTLRVGTAAASLYFMVVSAVPFLLPLLFQTVFNWSPIRSGALVLFIRQHKLEGNWQLAENGRELVKGAAPVAAAPGGGV